VLGFIHESGFINNKLAEIQIRSNQLIKIDNKKSLRPISNTFLRPIFLLSTNNTQMNFDSRFVRKPAPHRKWGIDQICCSNNEHNNT
jgi:hypothetical protein